jgi:hypothetical protein
VVEVEGFLAPDDPRLAALAKALGPESRVIAIGGYAVPLSAAELAGEPVKAAEPAKAPESNPAPAPEATSGDAA